MKIGFSRPDVGTEEAERVSKVIKSGWLTNGPVTAEFEKRISEISNADGCVCFDSCTGALETTLRVLNIGPGDEVITTPYTYTATAAVITFVGAKIVFCDLAPGSFEMDYEKLPDLITERTKAVIPVDIGGKLCDYGRLLQAVESKKSLFQPNGDIQEAFGRPIIVADAAHSFTATQCGKQSGELADFTCFSFHVIKVITTGGEGGAAVWKPVPGIAGDDVWYMMKLLGDHGQTLRGTAKDGCQWEYDIKYLGHNHIMTDMDAAMGMSQLERLKGMDGRRAIVTYLYDHKLKGVVESLIEHVPDDKSYRSSMHLYPVRIPGGEERRNAIYNKMFESGIKCNVHYKPLPMFTAYKSLGYDIQAFPEAYTRFSEELTLPYHSTLRREEIEYICGAITLAVKTK